MRSFKYTREDLINNPIAIWFSSRSQYIELCNYMGLLATGTSSVGVCSWHWKDNGTILVNHTCDGQATKDDNWYFKNGYTVINFEELFKEEVINSYEIF